MKGNSTALLFKAIKEGNLQQVKDLINGNNNLLNALYKPEEQIKNQTDNSNTPLHVAAEYGHLDIVQYLVDRGASLNSANDYQFMPLHVAVRSNHYDVAEYLISRGSNVNAATALYRVTPLHFAVAENNLDMMRLLLSKGANVNALDRSGSGVMQRALTASYKGVDADKLMESTRVLINNKVDLNMRGSEGDTLLHHAARKGLLDIVKFLIEEGADTNIVNNYGHTCQYYIDRMRRAAPHVAELAPAVVADPSNVAVEPVSTLAEPVPVVIAEPALNNNRAQQRRPVQQLEPVSIGVNPVPSSHMNSSSNIPPISAENIRVVSINDAPPPPPSSKGLLRNDRGMAERFPSASSVSLASSGDQRRNGVRFSSPVGGAAGRGEVFSPPPVPSKAAAGLEERFKESSIATLSEFNEAKSRVVEELKQNPSNFTAVLVERTMGNEPSDYGAGLRIAVVHDLLRDWACQENPNIKDAQTYLVSLGAPNEYNKAFGENEENYTPSKERGLVLMLGASGININDKKDILLSHLNGNDLAYTLSQATNVKGAQVMLNAAIESNMNISTGEVTGYLPFKIEQALEKCMGDANLAPIEHIMSACQNISLLAPLLQQEPFQRVQKVLDFYGAINAVIDEMETVASIVNMSKDDTNLISAIKLVINTTSDDGKLQNLKEALESQRYFDDHADAFTEKEYDKLGIVRSRSSSVGSSRSSSSTHSSAAGGEWMSEVGSGINGALGAAADNLLGGTVHTATSIAKGLGNILGWREKVTKEKEDSEVKGKGNRGGASRK